MFPEEQSLLSPAQIPVDLPQFRYVPLVSFDIDAVKYLFRDVYIIIPIHMHMKALVRFKNPKG